MQPVPETADAKLPPPTPPRPPKRAPQPSALWTALPAASHSEPADHHNAMLTVLRE